MTTDRHSHAEQKELIEDPEERARQEARNGVIQFDLVLDMVRDHVGANAKPFQLKSSVILRLQEAALRGIHPLAGTFRNTPVAITGSRHSPPDSFSVSDEISDMCSYVRANWSSHTALHLAAYLLWKLNWIHPFADGNGRTARAVSYLVMSIRLSTLLPGTPTIPEQIAADKGPYYDALEAADKALDSGAVDVSKLENMLADMLGRQLTGIPLLSEAARNQVYKVVESRVRRAPPELALRCFGSATPKDQMWAVGDYLILQVGPASEIVEAEKRQEEFGTPFPNLLAVGDDPATREVRSSESGLIQTSQNIRVGDQPIYSLERDVGLVLHGINVSWKSALVENSWGIVGALYVVRMGSRVTSDNLHGLLDALIARHLSSAR